ncbi:MAG: PIN domain-containing protein [Candidatus Scalindua sp.]
MNLLDTNIILRFLVADDTNKYERTKALFSLIESGRVTVDLEHTVIFEIIYVLKSYYKREKQEIYDAVIKIINLKNVRVKKKEMMKKALSIWKDKNMGLVDSQLIAMSASGDAKCIYSFDKGLDKFDSVKRIEP